MYKHFQIHAPSKVMSVSEACESILEGLEAGRIDIIKSIIDHVRNNKGTDFLLEVLSNDCCQEGTILHKAVRNNIIL